MELKTQLEQVKTVGIAGHVKPDGDCIGSTLAVYNYIKTYFPQIEVTLYLEPIPNIFKFLSGSEEIVHDCSKPQCHDLFLAMDCGDEGRLGDAAAYFQSAKKTFCIDHHISNSSFADVNYIFPHASSTSELVFELLEPEKITKEIAECIYVGIVHDTGVFQYSCTSAKTMNVAGQLMEKGINFTKIVDDTFYKKTYQQNRILGQALVKSKLQLDGKCVSSVITAAEMKEFEVEPKHLEGIVQQLRVTKDVDASIFLYENAEGSYKVSMRSNEKVDVAQVMMAFGGGGHVRAAGATVTGEPDDILQQVLEQVAKQL